MSTTLKHLLWSQLGASLDMLENAMVACPEAVWSPRNDDSVPLPAGGLQGGAVTEKSWQEFWYLASHTLFWFDYYLSEVPELFTPPEPFGKEEMDPAGVLPPRVYSKEELLTYLTYCRNVCRKWFAALDDETIMQRRFVTGRKDFSLAELVIYVTRHNQHHAAQLNLILRQRMNTAPKWVSRGKE